MVTLAQCAPRSLQALLLDPEYGLSALAVALQEVPKAWAEQAKRSPRQLTLQVSVRGGGSHVGQQCWRLSGAVALVRLVHCSLASAA